MTRPQPARRKLLATLHGTGPITDRSGRATSLLAEAMGYTSRPVSLSPLLSALEADGLVRRDVRGRRCFTIELTPKGRAFVDLDMELDSRRVGITSAADDTVNGRAPSDAIAASPSRPRGDGRVDGGAGPLELMRRELHDVLMELGALQHRVAELERLVRARSTASIDAATSRAQEGVVESFPASRTGRTG
jgi:DNA-binding MarR family transcriptional regulator